MSNLLFETKFVRTVAVLMAFLCSCSGAQLEVKSTAQQKAEPELKVDERDRMAKRLSELYGAKNCRDFFKAFPGTFADFDRMYGYREGNGNTLSSASGDHFAYFFGCAEVSDLEKLNKAIGIGVGGKYSDESPTEFHDPLLALIKKYPRETEASLGKLQDDKASSFWYFLFDMPHPTDPARLKEVESLVELLGKDSKQARLLLEQQKQLIADWREH